MVILYDYMPVTDVGVELFEAEAHWQTLFLNVCTASLNISNSFSGKCYGVPALY